MSDLDRSSILPNGGICGVKHSTIISYRIASTNDKGLHSGVSVKPVMSTTGECNMGSSLRRVTTLAVVLLEKVERIHEQCQ